MSYLRIKNWEKFQHYKDRNPTWIKLHQEMISSYEWVMSDSDDKKLLLIAIMIMAARFDNLILKDSLYIQKICNLKSLPDLDWLIEIDFCEECDKDFKQQKGEWPSRYISKEIKKMVLERDNYKCKFCGLSIDLEIDHVIPVSKGGKSEIDNLQVLCRSCNRKKRVCVADATIKENLRSLEKRREEKSREEKRKEDKEKFDSKNLDIQEPNQEFDEEVLEKPNQELKIHYSSKIHVLEIFDYWKLKMDRKDAVLDKRRFKLIDDSIRIYKKIKCKQAIDGCLKSDWHISHLKNDIVDIFKDSSSIERFIATLTVKPIEKEETAIDVCRRIERECEEEIKKQNEVKNV